MNVRSKAVVGIVILCTSVLIAQNIAQRVSFDSSPMPAAAHPRGPEPRVEHHFMMRANADGTLNLAARSQAIQQFRVLQFEAQSNFVASFAANAVWQSRGPTNSGGRVTEIVADPNNPNTIYVGAASGGVWKTTDGGSTFQPVFDNAGSLSIGAMAMHPDNPDILYVGTGEANPGGGTIAYPGDGVWKTTDGGLTWVSLGLEETRFIGRIAIDPQNPDTVFVAATGNMFDTDLDRGLYKSTNGGATWAQVLFVSNSTGAIDVAIDPFDSNKIYTAMWDRFWRPDNKVYGGPGSGIFRSSNGGVSFTKLTAGLPTAASQGGRIGIAVAPSSPNVVYATWANTDGTFQGFFRSLNGGDTWQRRTGSGLGNFYSTFGWWFGRVYVHPDDPNEVYNHGITLEKSTNGGTSFANVPGLHADQHAQWFSPSNPNLILEGNDGGIYRSTNRGASFSKLNTLPISQFYAIDVHPTQPNKIYGGMQDNGTDRTVNGNPNNYVGILGGDGLEVYINPSNTNIIWASTQRGGWNVSFNDAASFQNATSGINGVRNWKTPIELDPSNTGTGTATVMYMGSDRLFRSTNSGQSWTSVSPNLTDGEIFPGFGSITTIAVAPSTANTVYVGTDDGNVWVTQNLVNYTSIDNGLPDRWVTRLAVDPQNDATAYVTFSGYKQNDDRAHVFRTTNRGASWVDISGNLPDAPVNDIVIDPVDPSTLYLATDTGTFVTFDLGQQWSVLGAGLPLGVVVSDIKYIEGSPPTLFAGTFGRSIYSITLPTTPPSGDTLLAADFDSGTDGFFYVDDAFRGTAQPAFASGAHLPSGGLNGGGLQVTLGGIDNTTVTNMSGGWRTSFALDNGAQDVVVSFFYRLTQESDYEADEASEVLISLNANLMVADRVVGNGNGGGPISTGWQLFETNLGDLSSGNHTLTIGGFNNKKTFNNESTEVLIDDVLVAGSIGNAPEAGLVDDFETDLGWTANPNGVDTATTGHWQRANPESTNSNGPKQLGTANSGNFDLVTGATAGASVGVNDIDGGITSMRSPDFIVPDAPAVLSFAYYMAHTANSSNEDFLRVTVVGPSNSAVMLEERGSPDNDNAVWEAFSTSLNAFAGQTVYLLVEAADLGGGSIVEAAIDDVSVASGGSTRINADFR